MAQTIREIPEILALDASSQRIRIPPEIDVPITSRICRLIDTAEFRRLAQISQLGLVSFVYPAAHHSRFEHSLGVYRLALLFIRQLSHDPRFNALIEPADAEKLLLAALLHDIGHWPFCHLIEDMQLPAIPRHESFARQFLSSAQMAERLADDWSTSPAEIADLLDGQLHEPAQRVLRGILSGPIDVDKMDYLMRDSLHAGVPYGRNFDQARLIGSLCLNQGSDGLAVSNKGRTATEMMVFARYVMFSEVYWHHAVRAATAMFQRAFFLLHDQLNLEQHFQLTERPFVEQMRAVAADQPAAELLDRLFGPTRRLYKRWTEYSFFEHPEIFRQLARRDYQQLVRCSHSLAERLAERTGQPVRPDQVLIDAPPVKLEVQFAVEIHDSKRDQYRSLGEVSPVVKTLAETQFDNYVKRVRVFVAPELIDLVKQVDDEELLGEALDAS